MKICFRLLFLFVLITFLVSCSNRKEELKKDLSKINFAVFELYISGSIVAANNTTTEIKDVDCFKANGLDVLINKRSKGPEIVDALTSGSADFGTLAITPIALKIIDGGKFTIFATINTSNHDIKVVGYKSAGINDGYSLKNKRIGYVGGTYGEIFLDKYLKKYSINKSQVSLVSATPASLRDNFINKSLDAIIIWEPYIQDILSETNIDKNDIYLDIDTTLYIGRINLVSNTDILNSKKNEAAKLLRAIICGENALRNEPDKYREILEKWLGRKVGSLKNVFDANTFHVELDVNTIKKQLEEEVKWAKKSVFAQKNVSIPSSFDKFVDPSILKAVDSTRVKIN